MRNTIALIAMLCSCVAVAQPLLETEEGAEQIFWKGREQTYLRSVQSGGLTPGFAWEGVKIFRLRDGNCLQVERFDLKLAPMPGAPEVAFPEFKESRTKVPCP